MNLSDMPKHTENCQFSEYYAEFVIRASPDILWYDIQDVGSYQGSIYGVGAYKKQIVIYEDSYGSCSGCGEWGERKNMIFVTPSGMFIRILVKQNSTNKS